MSEELYKYIAKQLRKPQGKSAIEAGEKMNVGNQLINQYTIDMLELRKNDQVLEIGMGNGFFVKEILSMNENIKYFGCDYSKIMVAQARKNNKQYIKSAQAEFHFTNANKLPFPNETFDRVFSINTVYFWDTPEVVLNEIRRVLVPKGKLTLALRPKSSMRKYPFVKYGFNMFTKSDIIDLLITNNFKVTKYLEKEEPDREVNGLKLKVDVLIVSAEKHNNNL
jgi:ubiquinone/menaquinone biosynthesis C-methylase UbiE